VLGNDSPGSPLFLRICRAPAFFWHSFVPIPEFQAKNGQELPPEFLAGILYVYLTRPCSVELSALQRGHLECHLSIAGTVPNAEVWLSKPLILGVNA
jgi:hypothetical protein